MLDLGFDQLQSRQEPDPDRWLESTFLLIEQRLAAAPIQQREAIASTLADDLKVGVRLLERDDVHMNQTSEHRLPALVDADGSTSYLYDAESIDAIIRLGPIAAPTNKLLLNLLPPLFYLSIFVVVGLWLRPLLRDINVISDGAQRFAADYREPLSTAERTTELSALAENLDEMAARLSGVLRSQKELIAALSHEMRTPLARIRFALAVIGDRGDEKLNEELAAMNEDVQEIDDLVASMLNYARLDHPDIKMHWQAVPVSAWLEQVTNKSRSDALQVDGYIEDAPGKVWMDPRLMELALSNLLVNAGQYAGQQVRCSLAQVANDYVLTVEDDGKGIPEDLRGQVFKAFTRIDDSRNRETGGYGLGLAIVARVAELHGGTAAVNSSPSLGGARFSISWPVR
ncbi:MAG: ATP-binding protein [Gammaproteobacteria bacterium]|nr:ATP-binding protein [Gammaproteobacteria bacterium]